MNTLLPRLLLWFFTLAIFPIPLPLYAQSFQLEVLQRITLAALPLSPESERALAEQVSDRVLFHLESAEKKEIDPWYRDDLRIAWITVHWSQHGVPEWSLHRDTNPHVAATWQVLHCHPDQVWPRVIAAREAKLGKLHAQVWGKASSPRKPVRAVDLAEYERRANAA